MWWIAMVGCDDHLFPNRSYEAADTAASSYHPVGWSAPAVHGIAAKFQEQDCQACHGADFPPDGGTAGVSCDTCHDVAVSDWRTSCTFCHGDPEEGSGAPPQDIDDATDVATMSFAPHLVHVAETPLHVAWDCTTCHVRPDSALAPGHLFVGDTTPGLAEVAFVEGAGAGGSYVDGSCTVACHGDADGGLVSIRVDAGDVTCGDCHAVTEGWGRLSGAHEDHLTADDGGAIVCADCHSTAAPPNGGVVAIDPAHLGQHVDGTVQVDPVGMTWNGDGCTGSCHDETHSLKDNAWR